MTCSDFFGVVLFVTSVIGTTPYKNYAVTHDMCYLWVIIIILREMLVMSEQLIKPQPLKKMLYWREYSDEMGCVIVSIVGKDDFENDTLDFNEDLNIFLSNHDIHELQEHVYESDKSHQELMDIFHNNKTYTLLQSDMLREYLLDIGVLE